MMASIENHNSFDPTSWTDEFAELAQYDLTGIDFDEISKLQDSDSFDLNNTDLMEWNVLDVDANIAPPNAVEVEEAIEGNILMNAAMEEQPPSPETITLQSASTGVSGTFLELTSGSYQPPTSPGGFMQSASPGLIFDTDSLACLQPVSPGLIVETVPEVFLQTDSSDIILQATRGNPLQLPSREPMTVQPSPGPIMQPASPENFLQPSPGPIMQPASPENFLQPSLGAALQPASPSSMLSVNPPTPSPNQSISFECSQPDSTAQPIKWLILSSQSVQSYSQNENENVIEYPKKRGRKPKHAGGRPRRPRKPKVYEIDVPFEDKVAEKKRQNAIIAKKHRDNQKKEKETLTLQLTEVSIERDELMKEVETLKPQLRDVTNERDRLMKKVETLQEMLQKTMNLRQCRTNWIPGHQ